MRRPLGLGWERPPWRMPQLNTTRQGAEQPAPSVHLAHTNASARQAVLVPVELAQREAKLLSRHSEELTNRGLRAVLFSFPSCPTPPYPIPPNPSRRAR